jgi:hypothetical protein
VSFYRELMARQGEPPAEEKLQAMTRVIEVMAAAGRGRTFHVHDARGDVIYAVFYAWDSKRAYYLFGAGSPDAAEPWQGTLAHWEAFQHLAREHGVRQVDLEGVNSPKRGWFKLGLGGDLRPYYHIVKPTVPAAT